MAECGNDKRTYETSISDFCADGRGKDSRSHGTVAVGSYRGGEIRGMEKRVSRKK